ncbi:D-amino-acid transaminase [Fictibacillus sp. 5RED26]|jgi:D-alanine transaminase|uniref:D-amino-acid transaminase n=1 Tax=unclassified Fictibacillus TaxID=2644029 RepID=UPI0018CECD13|nr:MULTISPECIES: D-amino-acid transaminase [unclassified Fictibacillus]MBH0156098.1 D-amino-acid transaminase [Fictibacillus sp. 5RED26]MBH0165682.1 D-amino-acid transaminase [Fictibacillus sp. 7GRE50]
MENSYVLYHDQIIKDGSIPVDPQDRGYLFGDGIYEVVFVYDKKPFAFKEHFARFEQSAKKLELAMPYDVSTFKKLTDELISKNNIENGMVYIQMTRGVAPRNHLYERNMQSVVTGFAKSVSLENIAKSQASGISTYLTEDIRWLRCDIKSLNLLGNVMAKRKAADFDCQEAIQHRDGTVTEGSSSNVFIVINGTLKTHPSTNLILNGITRQIVITLALENGISVLEEAFSVDDLLNADEVFITSTTMEVTPVTKLVGSENQTYDIGPVTLKLQDHFKRQIKKNTSVVN